LVVVGQSPAQSLSELRISESQNSEGVDQEQNARQGCTIARTLLRRLQEATHGLEHDQRIAIGAVEDELTYFSQDSAAAACSDVGDDKVWEVVNPSLDRLLGFG
jgi:hypothetical protein